MIVAFVCSMELILIPNCSLLYLHSFLEKGYSNEYDYYNKPQINGVALVMANRLFPGQFNLFAIV